MPIGAAVTWDDVDCEVNVIAGGEAPNPSRLLSHPGSWSLTAHMNGKVQAKAHQAPAVTNARGSSAAPRYQPAPVHREGANGPDTWPQHHPRETATVCRCWPCSYPRCLRRRGWRFPIASSPRWGQLAAGNDERLYPGIGEHPGHVAVPAEPGHHHPRGPTSHARGPVRSTLSIEQE